MKKRKIILLVISLFVLLLSSCKKDDNPVTPENPLVGTWGLFKETIDGVVQPLYGSTTLTFQDDNKYSYVFTDYFGMWASSTGTWSVSNGKLTIVTNNVSDIYDYQIINNTKLVFTQTISGSVSVLEFNKNNSPQNHLPKILSLTANPTTVFLNSETTLTCIATDEDADNLTISWTATRGTFSNGVVGVTVKWIAPSIVGKDTITASVSDGKQTILGKLEIIVEDPIVGTWELIKSTENGVVVPLQFSNTITFQSDNKFTSVINLTTGLLYITGTWSVTNGKLTIISTIPSTDIFDYQIINNTKLILTQTRSGIIYSSEYNKK